MTVFKRFLLTAAALAFLMPGSVQAQMIGSLKGLHDNGVGNIMATAEMLDDGMYAYRPTEEVRTTGQILAHIANAQYMFCAAVAGESSPNSQNFEETATTKAAIVAVPLLIMVGSPNGFTTPPLFPGT